MGYKKRYFYKGIEHFVDSSVFYSDIERWEKAGKPELWVMLDEQPPYAVYLEETKGYLGLFVDRKLYAKTVGMIINATKFGILVVSSEEIPLKKCIWR